MIFVISSDIWGLWDILSSKRKEPGAGFSQLDLLGATSFLPETAQGEGSVGAGSSVGDLIESVF